VSSLLSASAELLVPYRPTQGHKIVATSSHHKLYKNLFAPGLHPGPRCGSIQRSPRPPLCWGGGPSPISKNPASAFRASIDHLPSPGKNPAGTHVYLVFGYSLAFLRLHILHLRKFYSCSLHTNLSLLSTSTSCTSFDFIAVGPTRYQQPSCFSARTRRAPRHPSPLPPRTCLQSSLTVVGGCDGAEMLILARCRLRFHAARAKINRHPSAPRKNVTLRSVAGIYGIAALYT